MDRIRALFEVEARIKQDKLKAVKRLDYRLEHAKPIVESVKVTVCSAFFGLKRGVEVVKRRRAS